MKHAWTVLAASLLLVFALAACGGGDSNTGTDDNNGVNDSNNAGMNDGQVGANGSNDPANNPNDADRNETGRGDSLLDDAEDALDDAGDALTGGSPAKQRHTGSLIRGASFDQMIRNGRVHDRDGNLSDFENSVTPGVMF